MRTVHHLRTRYIRTVPGLPWFQQWRDPTTGTVTAAGPFDTQLDAWRCHHGKRHPVGEPYQSPFLSGERPDDEIRKSYNLP